MSTLPTPIQPSRLLDCARNYLASRVTSGGMLEGPTNLFRRRVLEPFLLPEALETAWSESASDAKGLSVFSGFLDRIGARWECSPADLHRIPRSGPLVVVANHPFGMVEGAVLGALLGKMRPDVKFLANSLLLHVPEAKDLVIPLDPFGKGAKTNWAFLRKSLTWLRKGGVLVVFPAGEVASFQLPKMEVVDSDWHETIGGLLRLSRAPVVPIFFHGSNGPGFQLAGLVHPALRTALLPRELLNKRGTVTLASVGQPISPETLARFPDDRLRTNYLRHRTYLLEARGHGRRRWSIALPKAPVSPASNPERFAEEISILGPERVLATSGPLQVWTASAPEIPHVLREIGRLREQTFREIGEGTGRSLDLDAFDAYYHHLWLWNTETREVCGAYRFASTDEVTQANALYTNTLFHFRPGLIESFGPALELGRSFVRTEYQKSYQALLLLWKGIGAWVARHPRHRILFGPVSISAGYQYASRALMVAYLESHCSNSQLLGAVEPRREFRVRRWRGCNVPELAPLLSTLGELSDVVADLEPDGKGLPVLLRQYLNLGGTMLAFNVDSSFSHVVDGLVMVDLLRLSPRLLAKYLGKEGAGTFLALRR